MSDDSSALLALTDAWNGVIETSERVKALGPPAGLDLDSHHQVVLAHSNAVMALRGLIERLREKPPEV